MATLTDLTATEQARLIQEKQISAVELIDASLARIEQVQKIYNPFALTLADEALATAAKIDNSGIDPSKPLLGVPIAFKDFTPTAGHRTTRGSYAFKDWIPESDPAIVRRFKQAGAIVIGKTTTPEFAHSSFTRSPLFGETYNPWSRHRSSGGSSGGSAVAVATGCVAIAEGTDMGGSVRIPAALCGCVGLKPSLGRIPMDILPTVFDDMSHFGPLSRSIEDAVVFLSVAEGADEWDITSQRVPTPLPEVIDRDLTGLRIAVSENLGFYAVHPEVLSNFKLTIDVLRDAGADIVATDIDWNDDIVEAWNTWWSVYLAAAFGDCLGEYKAKMDSELVATIEAGLRVSAVEFARIDQTRTRLWHDMANIFQSSDVLICPTMALPAPDIHSKDSDFSRIDGDGMLHGLEMTCIFNMIGQCPALSVPSGMTNENLPTAVQIVGRRFDDPTVLRIGFVIEKLRPWPQWQP